MISSRLHWGGVNPHALNVLLTRLIFCFFAEDTGIFPKPNMMTNAIAANTQDSNVNDVAVFLSQLFTVLDESTDDPARATLPISLQAFPYVGGGLFSERIEIPRFNRKARQLLLECGAMQWSDISPVIFGSMFQAVMDPEKRRSLGAHFTSERNIFKVIRPLFLDGLEEELRRILCMRSGKDKLSALQTYRDKLSKLGFLDPACGSGNFLIVAYREVRELELRTLLALKEEGDFQAKRIWLDVSLLSKVSIEQFHGIEIEEFPTQIARVSLILMEHVMNVKIGKVFGIAPNPLPLKHKANIVCANALTTPWEEIVPPDKLHYIFGNPPFIGSSNMTKEQKSDAKTVFAARRCTAKLDYVCSWYEMASIFIQWNQTIECAFVSTNSICQGEQVSTLWRPLLQRGLVINFAHQTFQWRNEATQNAAVYCVIIGFSLFDRKTKSIWHYSTVRSEPVCISCKQINAYLLDFAQIIVNPANNPLCDVTPMVYGNKPTDGGNLIINAADIDVFQEEEPQAIPYIHPFIGAEEFLNSKTRYCLWLVDAPAEVLSLPKIKSRILAVQKFRKVSTKKATRECADCGHLFQEIRFNNPPEALLIPRHSSERRHYIPFGFIAAGSIIGDTCQMIPNATYYDFGIITSAMHMAWVKTVCGRLKSDYRYSRDICYNTFPWPDATDIQKDMVSALAEDVIMTRELHPEMTLADMYDPDKMPDDLKDAHNKLDLAVDALYRKKPFTGDDDRLQLLFSLYEKLVKEQNNA